MDKRGFTLIELIITMALVGIISAISIPKINKDYGYTDSVINNIAYIVRFTREETMKGNTSVSISFSPKKVEVAGMDTIDIKEKFVLGYKDHAGSFVEIRTLNQIDIEFNVDGTLKKPVDGINIAIANKNDLSSCKSIIITTVGATIIE